MARIEKYLIRDFNDPDVKTTYQIAVPDNSVFLGKVKVLHDGIYAFYSLSEILMSTAGVRYDKYIILAPNQGIPDNADLIDILDIIIEVAPNSELGSSAEASQGILLFPVYKIK